MSQKPRAESSFMRRPHATVACHHLPTAEEALLKYDGPGEYTIIWQDKSTCEVLRVLLLD